MKIELNCFTPYLPYDIRIQDRNSNYPLTGSKLDEWFNWGDGIDQEKLILRPLSDLTKEIEHNGERFVPLSKLAELFYDRSKSKYTTTHFDNPRETFHNTYTVNCCVENDSRRYLYYSINKDVIKNEYRVLEKLFEWHFDVFGLIDAGLAIDINTLES